MKRIKILYIILISFLITSSCQEDDYLEEIQITQESSIDEDGIRLKIEKYMNQHSSGSVQGASCYGDYLFQFQDHNENVYIYNVREKTYIETLGMEPVQFNHCNNVSFSNIFFDERDEFPLLYVSGSGNGNYNQVQVYRIFHYERGFRLEKVQNIKLPKGNEDNHMYWTQVIIDNDNNFMYVLSKTMNSGGTFISQLAVPSLDSADIQLIDSDILDQYEVSDSAHKQGAVIDKGFLYIMYGVPAWGDTNYLRVIDLANRKDYLTINVSDLGFNQEFEGLTVYNNMFIAPTNNAGIFKMRFLSK